MDSDLMAKDLEQQRLSHPRKKASKQIWLLVSDFGKGPECYEREREKVKMGEVYL